MRYLIVGFLGPLMLIGAFLLGMWVEGPHKAPKPNDAVVANASAWIILQFKAAGCAIPSGPELKSVTAIDENYSRVILRQACDLSDGRYYFTASIKAPQDPFKPPTGRLIAKSNPVKPAKS